MHLHLTHLLVTHSPVSFTLCISAVRLLPLPGAAARSRAQRVRVRSASGSPPPAQRAHTSSVGASMASLATGAAAAAATVRATQATVSITLASRVAQRSSRAHLSAAAQASSALGFPITTGTDAAAALSSIALSGTVGQAAALAAAAASTAPLASALVDSLVTLSETPPFALPTVAPLASASRSYHAGDNPFSDATSLTGQLPPIPHAPYSQWARPSSSVPVGATPDLWPLNAVLSLQPLRHNSHQHTLHPFNLKLPLAGVGAPPVSSRVGLRDARLGSVLNFYCILCAAHLHHGGADLIGTHDHSVLWACLACGPSAASPNRPFRYVYCAHCVCFRGNSHITR
jgi:hypothetical protein